MFNLIQICKKTGITVVFNNSISQGQLTVKKNREKKTSTTESAGVM